MRIHSFFPLPFLILLFSRADALFFHGVLRCQYTSFDDAVYVEQFYFNKVLQIQYNSTLGNFTGYTEKTKEVANALNKSPSIMKQRKKNKETCKSYISFVFDTSSKAVEPTVRLRSVEAADSKHPVVLVCAVHDFYPKQIRVTWLRNGQKVTSDATSTDELSNGNWLFQMHSYLEFTPTPGEKITCMVEHASLKEPKLYDWDPTPESQRNKIAVGTSVLLVGLVVFVIGLVYCKKNTAGW